MLKLFVIELQLENHSLTVWGLYFVVILITEVYTSLFSPLDRFGLILVKHEVKLEGFLVVLAVGL